jgi:HAD superfamily hydrolase (TIGR01509 family)
MSVRAVLFDIDGTLVDSNFLHVDAWSKALQDVDRGVPSWRVQRAIGADSEKLLQLLLGDVPDEVKDRAKQLNSSNYAELIPRLDVLPGAREIVSELSTRGLRVVLATSAPPEELEALLEVLDLDEHLHAVTSADDVETAKPEPDIIETALQRAGVDAADAIMVGDAVWDVIAAKRAGVRTVCVLSGGTGRQELLDAGAIAVFDDTADLLEHLDEVLG